MTAIDKIAARETVSREAELARFTEWAHGFNEKWTAGDVSDGAIDLDRDRDGWECGETQLLHAAWMAALRAEPSAPSDPEEEHPEDLMCAICGSDPCVCE